MPRRAPRRAGAAACAVLLTALLAACTGHHDPGPTVSARLGPQGGTVGATGSPAQVEIGQGAITGTVTVTIAPAGAVPDSPMLDQGAVATGRPVEIKVSGPLPGATVRLPFDPATQLPPQASTANAFIAVFNTDWGTWIPLDTTYDAATRHLVATAPHFSWFRTYVVNPLKSVAHGIKTGLDLLGAMARDYFSGTGSAIWEALNGEQQSLDCSKPAPNWTVKTSASELSGCVTVDDKSGDATVHVRSTLRFPLTLDLPTAMRRAPWQIAAGDDPLDWLLRISEGPMGAAYITGRGVGQAIVPVATAKQDPVAVEMVAEPDDWAWAVRSVVTAYSFMAGEVDYIKVALRDETFRAQIIAATEDATTIQEFIVRVRTLVVERESVKGQDIAALNALTKTLDAMSCLTGLVKLGPAAASFSLEELVKAGTEAARQCVNTVMEKVGPAEATKDVIGMLAAVGDGINTIASVWDAVRQGALHFGARNTITATHATQPVAVNPADAARVYFAPGGLLPSSGEIAPDYAMVSNDSSFALTDIVWTEWSNTRAVGTGTAVVNPCSPDCADDRHRDRFPVKILLSDPVHVCGGVFYSHLLVTDTSKPAAGVSPGDTYDVQPFC